MKASSQRLVRPFAVILKPWFLLTGQEQRAVLLILALAIIGLAARYWHLHRELPDPYEPAGLDHPAKR